jgi:pyruvate/2-oxoglutarate dehydrogenase complex dihydrolipoamide dehydrogenase (E3) component
LDERGYIRVNERLEPTTPGVWAIGERSGSPQFTHVSIDDFRIIRDNLAEGTAARADGWSLIACLPSLHSLASD